MSDYISRQAAIKLIEEDIPITLNPIEVVANILAELEEVPTVDVRDYATAHKLVCGGGRDGTTCWFECDNCGLSVDVGDVFCKHCGARFVP